MILVTGATGAVGGRVARFLALRGLLDNEGAARSLMAPYGLAVDGRGHLYVVDAYNHRIHKLAVGGLARDRFAAYQCSNLPTLPTHFLGTHRHGISMVNSSLGPL